MLRFVTALFILLSFSGCGDDKKPTAPPHVDPVQDREYPYVEITSPAQGARLPYGAVRITVYATDDTGIQVVYTIVDGVTKSADRSAPYICSPIIARGGHRICAQAYDLVGKLSWDCIDITVY